MALFEPERYFSRLSFIDISFDIERLGYECVLLDVDNTVLTRDTRTVPRDILLWLSKLKSTGIGVCFLSNNFHRDVLEVANELNISIVAKALKPLPFGFYRACKLMDVSPKQTLMIGDQLGTDIVGAHIAGLHAYMVCPLATEDLPYAKVMRVFERAFLKGKEPEGVSCLGETIATSDKA